MAKSKIKGKPPKGYDSWFEYDLHQGVLKPCKFHTHKVMYVQHKVYEPDFTIESDLITVHIEVKGRFRDSEEARKYIDVSKGLTAFEELVFLFYDANTPMPRARRRKDGTKFTMGEWAKSHDFRYFTADNVHLLLSEGQSC